MPSREALTLTPGRHPFEAAAFIVAVAVGLAGAIATEPRSAALREVLPSWTIVAFYAAWAAWGAIGLAGLALEDQECRLQVERAALYGVGYSSVAYCVGAFIAAGWSAWTAAIGVGAVSPAAAWRIRQTHNDLQSLRAAREDPQPADPPPLARPDVEPSR